MGVRQPHDAAPRDERASVKVLLDPGLRERLRTAAHLLRVDLQQLVAAALIERLATITTDPVGGHPLGDRRVQFRAELDVELRTYLRETAEALSISERQLVVDALEAKLDVLDLEQLAAAREAALARLERQARLRRQSDRAVAAVDAAAARAAIDHEALAPRRDDRGPRLAERRNSG